MQRAGLGQVMRENPQESVVEGGFRCSDCVFRSLLCAVLPDGTGCGEPGPSDAGPGNVDFFSYLCTKPRVAAVIIHVVQTADFCLYTSPIAILDVCGGKNVDFSRNVFQMRRNLPGFLAISGFLRFFFRAGPVPHFVRRRPRCGIAAVPCQQMLNTKNNSL